MRRGGGGELEEEEGEVVLGGGAPPRSPRTRSLTRAEEVVGEARAAGGEEGGGAGGLGRATDSDLERVRLRLEQLEKDRKISERMAGQLEDENAREEARRSRGKGPQKVGLPWEQYRLLSRGGGPGGGGGSEGGGGGEEEEEKRHDGRVRELSPAARVAAAIAQADEEDMEAVARAMRGFGLDGGRKEKEERGERKRGRKKEEERGKKGGKKKKGTVERQRKGGRPLVLAVEKAARGVGASSDSSSSSSDDPSSSSGDSSSSSSSSSSDSSSEDGGRRRGRGKKSRKRKKARKRNEGRYKLLTKFAVRQGFADTAAMFRAWRIENDVGVARGNEVKLLAAAVDALSGSRSGLRRAREMLAARLLSIHMAYSQRGADGLPSWQLGEAIEVTPRDDVVSRTLLDEAVRRATRLMALQAKTDAAKGKAKK